jgi:hypothetical protein
VLNKLLDRLLTEWRLIRRVPLNFGCVCLLSAVLIFLFFSWAFKETVSVQSGTIRAYKDRFGDLSAQPKVGQTNILAQVLVYTNEPNAERLVPPATNFPAVAYKSDGGAMFMWDTKSQSWK